MFTQRLLGRTEFGVPPVSPADDRDGAFAVPETCSAFAAFAPTFSLLETPRGTEYRDPAHAADLAAQNADALAELEGDADDEDEEEEQAEESTEEAEEC